MKIINNQPKGFTLIELLVVIGIIALLASILLASLSQSKTKADNSARNSMIVQYRNALELYRSNDPNGLYPYPGNKTQWRCLGTYGTGFCGRDIGVISDSGLSGALTGYISGFPAVSNKSFVYSTDSKSYLGATYRCTSGILDPNDNTKYLGCKTIVVGWVIEDSAQLCGPGDNDDTSQVALSIDVNKARGCKLLMGS